MIQCEFHSLKTFSSYFKMFFCRYKGFLDTVEIVMNNKNGCEKYPYMDMDEHCKF